MKKIFIISIITLFVVGCKREQTPRELSKSEPLVKAIPQCYNGMLDTNEIGVDCGGPCPTCTIVAPSCTAAPNSLVIGTYTSSATNTNCYEIGGNYKMTGTYSNGTYTIYIGGPTPNIAFGSYYYIQNTSSAGGNNALVDFNDAAYGALSLSSGKIYMSQTSGVYHATICDGVAYSSVYSSTISAIKGNISCP